MKNHRLLFSPAILAAIALACNLPEVNQEDKMLILGIQAAPTASSNRYTATVNVSTHSTSDILFCYRDGAQVFTKTVAESDQSDQYSFSFDPGDPGEHTLKCVSADSGEAESTTFTVAAAVTPAPTDTPAPSDTQPIAPHPRI